MTTFKQRQASREFKRAFGQFCFALFIIVPGLVVFGGFFGLVVGIAMGAR